MINLIWAMDNDWLVGKDNELPWHYKEDLLYYKEKTQGKTVLMGLNTYYSLKGYYKSKPLPYGKIYVASLEEVELEDAIIINDVNHFLESCEEELWVVGGATIYKLSLPYANRLYITFVDGKHEGNVYFPKFDLDASYKLVSNRDSNVLHFRVYERK